ncbi:DUF2813 domain-containing protein [Mesosutterella sp. OilRF-GAM-744-9]|uniref:DUF2813 domain-containing protein n=1 Tax=Mesosutterella porci TaxID=2915351 RepID=A0ABS9MU01_9BURK|nr:AAA family ATPase [Mesosutterella sp. oilRF-744-WT-GAM-9]MCG5031493.1 DUF2813 domain-containing protein [Mesosutterella sp. oilRF-744-WT-GAM-9]
MIRLERLRIRGFRGISSLEMTLGPQTVLIGPNSAGKSTVLAALRLALEPGGSTRPSTDFFVDSSGRRGEEALVDLMFVPCRADGARAERFEGLWKEALGALASHEPGSGREFFAFRTRLRQGSGESAAGLERRLLVRWREEEGAVLAQPPSCFTLVPVRSGSGLAAELRRPGSFVSRALRELSPGGPEEGLEEKDFGALRAAVERFVSVLDGQIPARALPRGPVTLGEVKRLFSLIGRGEAPAAFAPFLEESGGGRIALLLSTITLERLLAAQRAGRGEASHFITAVEESELHLHPTAQRSITGHLRQLPGEVLLATHSPFVASGIEPLNYRFMVRAGGRVRVRWLPRRTDPADIRSIKRLILRNRGDMLFARGLILAEGITEEQLLRGMFRVRFGAPPEDFGLSILGVEGKSYEPYLRMAAVMQRPFVVVSDCDGDAKEVLRRQASRVFAEQGLPGGPAAGCGLFFLSEGLAMEGELASRESLRGLIALALSRMYADRARCGEDWRRRQERRILREPPSSLRRRMEKTKSEYSGFLAEAIEENPFGQPASELIPPAVGRAFDRVAGWLAPA